jgi:hypothetical protein
MGRIIILSCCLIFAAGCSSDDDPIDCEKNGPSIDLNHVISATSCSASDGGIEVAVSGGKEPYSYLVNGELFEGGGSITNLSAGVYSVTVRDANFCSASIDNITIQAADFSFSTILEPNTSCLGGNGAVTIEVTSTNPPYSYREADGDFSIENYFTGLTTGNHTFSVKDNNDCIVTLTVTIPQGKTGTSWSDDILPIMEKNCAISGCHNGVSRANNFREYASAKTHAKAIKTKTQDRSMPFDGSLTQNQIDLIACWVDDGALQN